MRNDLRLACLCFGTYYGSTIGKQKSTHGLLQDEDASTYGIFDFGDSVEKDDVPHWER